MTYSRQIIDAHGAPTTELRYEPEYPELYDDDFPDTEKAMALNCLHSAKYQLDNLNENSSFSKEQRIELTKRFIDNAIKALSK
ncbi:hypothetical protein [Anabaena azotica]|uniref:Uncharacterized protein n=1 Tax=Anabaena azotica FACHB-119 TaxID=947527 RepID=A0ABR8D0F3_9NOST|nr:hypothetical protein [Anabaena azotica]MBD2499871.1 hypothetical protein [Anabaena azotica FACHB-119]